MTFKLRSHKKHFTLKIGNTRTKIIMSEARISLQKYDINDPRARVLRRFQQSERSLKFPIPATQILASDRSVEFASSSYF